jgi:DNA-directed RNA polymerase subunit M/transcription elongation factor TFIIS
MSEEKRQPVTIADLHAAGMRLSIDCLKCGRFGYLDAARFRDDDPVPALPKRYRFKCGRCGSRKVTTRPMQCIHAGEWPGENN